LRFPTVKPNRTSGASPRVQAAFIVNQARAARNDRARPAASTAANSRGDLSLRAAPKALLRMAAAMTARGGTSRAALGEPLSGREPLAALRDGPRSSTPAARPHADEPCAGSLTLKADRFVSLPLFFLTGTPKQLRRADC
jgi:hypothetical protein